MGSVVGKKVCAETIAAPGWERAPLGSAAAQSRDGACNASATNEWRVRFCANPGCIETLPMLSRLDKRYCSGRCRTQALRARRRGVDPLVAISSAEASRAARRIVLEQVADELERRASELRALGC